MLPTVDDEKYFELTRSIFRIVAELGPSHTTMDHVSKQLSMSKRTLYEIFGSKDEMIKSVLTYLHQLYVIEITKILHNSSNVMEAFAKVMNFHQKILATMKSEFFRDFDTRYSHLKPEYDSKQKSWVQHMESALNLGMRQGVFRHDINSKLTIRILRMQMESLKRMEEFFPADITPAEVYEEIGISFLRSIASPKGMMILDSLHLRNQNKENSNKKTK